MSDSILKRWNNQKLIWYVLLIAVEAVLLWRIKIWVVPIWLVFIIGFRLLQVDKRSIQYRISVHTVFCILLLLLLKNFLVILFAALYIIWLIAFDLWIRKTFLPIPAIAMGEMKENLSFCSVKKNVPKERHSVLEAIDEYQVPAVIAWGNLEEEILAWIDQRRCIVFLVGPDPVPYAFQKIGNFKNVWIRKPVIPD